MASFHLQNNYQMSLVTQLSFTYGFNATTSSYIAQSDNSASLWLPLIAVIVFVILIAISLVAGRLCCTVRHRQEPQLPIIDVEANVAECNVNEAFSHLPHPTVPSTPPPTYSALERQMSYVSYISQCSSQIEIPPSYEDAVTSQYSALPENQESSHQIPTGSKSTRRLPDIFRVFSRSQSVDVGRSSSVTDAASDATQSTRRRLSTSASRSTGVARLPSPVVVQTVNGTQQNLPYIASETEGASSSENNPSFHRSPSVPEEESTSSNVDVDNSNVDDVIVSFF